MKKIVSLLSAVTIFTSSTVAPISAGAHINSIIKNQNDNVYPPDNFFNVLRTLHNSFSKDDLVKWQKNKEALKIIEEYTNKFYETFFKKDGQLVSLTSTPKDEVVVQTFSNTFTNNSPSPQLFRTQEYSKEITNTHSFSVSLSEKISLRTSFRIPFISKTEMTIDLSSEQKWSESTTTTEKIVNPSQEMVVSPYSVGKVKYVIRQGTYHTDGVLRFVGNIMNKIEFPVFYTKNDGTFGYNIQKFYLGLVVALYELYGYVERLDPGSSEYSIFSLIDDDDMNQNVYLNLPISWDSQGGSLDVIMDEEPL